MAGSISVELHDLRFIASHGVYADEQKLKNEFAVDLSIRFDPKKDLIQKIGDTIDYVKVYSLVKEEMQSPKQLLEETAMNIINRLKEQFMNIEEMTISIKKLHPPIANFMGSVGVSYKKVFN